MTCVIVRRDVFGAAAGERFMLASRLVSPSRDCRVSWHQVLWVTGAWIWRGCLQRPLRLRFGCFRGQHISLAGLSRSARLRDQPHWLRWVPVQKNLLVIVFVESISRLQEIE